MIFFYMVALVSFKKTTAALRPIPDLPGFGRERNAAAVKLYIRNDESEHRYGDDDLTVSRG